MHVAQRSRQSVPGRPAPGRCTPQPPRARRPDGPVSSAQLKTNPEMTRLLNVIQSDDSYIYIYKMPCLWRLKPSFVNWNTNIWSNF